MASESGSSPSSTSSLSPSSSHATPVVYSRFSSVAPLLALLSCVLYSCNGELLQAIQQSDEASQARTSPLLNLVLCHLGGLVFMPSTMCYRPEGKRESAAPASVRGFALLFSILLMGYNYAWLLSTRFLHVGLTNAVFQTSAAMVYIASVALFGESVSFCRVLGVGMCLFGSALASVGAESHLSGTSAAKTAAGISLAAMAAMGMTVYQVLFRKVYGHLKYDVSFLMEFGIWVGIMHLVAMLPLVFFAHAVGFEPLEVPQTAKAVMAVTLSAAIASTVNALYLCIVMWGTPMLLPCASALSLPMMVGLDVALHGARPTAIEVVGHILVMASLPMILDLVGDKPQPGLAGSLQSSDVRQGKGV